MLHECIVFNQYVPTCQAELELAKKHTERMANTNTELTDIKQQKEDIEDNKFCLEMEMCADKERLQGLMV